VKHSPDLGAAEPGFRHLCVAVMGFAPDPRPSRPFRSHGASPGPRVKRPGRSDTDEGATLRSDIEPAVDFSPHGRGDPVGVAPPQAGARFPNRVCEPDGPVAAGLVIEPPAPHAVAPRCQVCQCEPGLVERPFHGPGHLPALQAAQGVCGHEVDPAADKPEGMDEEVRSGERVARS
jgi:hypothetical protein